MNYPYEIIRVVVTSCVSPISLRINSCFSSTVKYLSLVLIMLLLNIKLIPGFIFFELSEKEESF